MVTLFETFRSQRWQNNTHIQPLLTGQQVKQLEQLACQRQQIASYELMERAGLAAFRMLQQHFAGCQRILIVCGSGNNGGDGYVVARLAHQHGMSVDVVAMTEPKPHLDAYLAYQQFLAAGLTPISDSQPSQADYDLIVDALLGTGISGAVRPDYLSWIRWMNQVALPVLSLDVPSGLCADTGCQLPEAVQATETMTFIATKRGLLTADGLDCCGELYCDALDVEIDTAVVAGHCVWQTDLSAYQNLLSERKRNSHKGQMGHVVVVGGERGMPGAVAMSAQAALRCGAGLVSVLTHPDNVSIVAAQCAELMVQGIEASSEQTQALFQQADVLVIGPGLGRTEWSKTVFDRCFAETFKAFKVLDADALYWLAQGSLNNMALQRCLMTPHPGEAARLLQQSNAVVQQDRFAAVKALFQQYQMPCLLKGAGSLMGLSSEQFMLANVGNPGMATAGMGDILAGVIAALLGQGLDALEALPLAVCLHGHAADWVAQQQGARGILATDLLLPLQGLVNPEPL